MWLLCGDAGQVIASIRRTATCRGLTAAARKPADTCADYIERYKAYVQYDAYLKAGLPIAKPQGEQFAIAGGDNDRESRDLA